MVEDEFGRAGNEFYNYFSWNFNFISIKYPKIPILQIHIAGETVKEFFNFTIIYNIILCGIHEGCGSIIYGEKSPLIVLHSKNGPENALSFATLHNTVYTSHSR